MCNIIINNDLYHSSSSCIKKLKSLSVKPPFWLFYEEVADDASFPAAFINPSVCFSSWENPKILLIVSSIYNFTSKLDVGFA